MCFLRLNQYLWFRHPIEALLWIRHGWCIDKEGTSYFNRNRQKTVQTGIIGKKPKLRNIYLSQGLVLITKDY